ncbi:hypothetical protein [Clostridium estertheticum]|uniref:hypothetical protein n=1 Tax=Clostridium estertheticum TaxID=238834 RepID=UPI001C6DD93E|nr:hypothetical protein [Clostridium estertheticum]MBW9154075.1 hypothetical protein [Clostridium estertheticum]WLC83458.1 hypothetical protein KTC97_15405 [Clostridium estertheticum]
MISDRLGLYFCGENYNLDKVLTKIKPKEYPNLCYFKTMKSWNESVFLIEKTQINYLSLSK